VLERVCRQIREWEDAGFEVPRIAINVAPIHFRQADFLKQVRRTLQKHAIDPEQIELELTETSLMEDTDEVHRCLRGLKDTGVRLAIDDFGTGYSCLNYLRRFPIDVLKIDRVFVADLDAGAGGQEICRVILSIAQRLSLETVAEGIEQESQRQFLREHGCQYGQGHYFGIPISASAAAARWMRSANAARRSYAVSSGSGGAA
jgi:EAL domain-containing protein (putative c-di-GMP-specific phosphodiesterase class I)